MVTLSVTPLTRSQMAEHSLHGDHSRSTTAKFDGLHLLDLVSNRTLSGPAAY